MPYSQDLRDKQADQATRVVVDSNIGEADRPDYECDSHKNQWKLAQVVRDVYRGTAHMRTKGEPYLPRLKRESEVSYKKRLGKARLFNATRRTADGLTGMVYRKDPILSEETSPDILEHTKNIDLAGRDLASFAKDVFTAGGLDGISFVYVDYPQVWDDGARRSRAALQRGNIRPFWVHVQLEDLINWQWEIQNGSPVLTLAVFKESEIEPVGAYGQQDVTRYRVLRPGSFEVWQERSDPLRWEMVDWGDVSLSYIPLFPFYFRRTGFFEAEPPLLDLAYENIGHFELKSEREKSRTIAHIPLLFLKDFPDDEEIKVSEAEAFRATGSDADMKWVVYSGEALSESREDLRDTEQRMATLGLSLLMARPSPQTSNQQTATSDLLRKGESDSALMTAVSAEENCLNNALGAHAELMSVGLLRKAEPGTIRLNRDFHAQQMTAEQVNALSLLVSEGKLDLDTFWDALVAGEWLPENFDRELVRERIANDGMLNIVPIEREAA